MNPESSSEEELVPEEEDDEQNGDASADCNPEIKNEITFKNLAFDLLGNYW